MNFLLKALYVKALFMFFPSTMLFMTLGNAMAQNVAKAQNDLDLPIRKIVEKYYDGKNFYVGVAPKGSFLTSGVDNERRLNLLLSEFSYITPENSFKQASVYTHPGAPWKADEYRQWIEVARKNNMVVRAHGPVSPQCSRWVKGMLDGKRTGAELLPVMEHYVTELSKDLEKNRDVVKWMDVVNETVVGGETNKSSYKVGDWFGPIDGEDFQNPWLMIGQDQSTDLQVPLYIIRAFELANQYAPGVKMLYNHHHPQLQQLAWDKVKATVLFLRERGLRVDAVGWQAHVTLGWEKNSKNMKDLEALIDWCYDNHLEFHITELNVVRDPRFNEETLPELAETFYALTALMAKKVGRGAVGINFWDFESTEMKTASNANRGGIFDTQLSRQSPQYLAIKRALIEHGRIINKLNSK